MTDTLKRLSRSIGEVVERRAVVASEAEPLFGLIVRMREAGETAALITDPDGGVAGVLAAEELVDRTLVTLEPGRPIAGLSFPTRRSPALRRPYQIAVAQSRRPPVAHPLQRNKDHRLQ